MKFNDRVTMDELKKRGIPTFNECEHFLVEPHPNTHQTLVIKLENNKFLTVNIFPQSDNVDVQFHGDHTYHEFGKIKAFFDIRETPKEVKETNEELTNP